MLEFVMDHAEAIVTTFVGAVIGYLVSLGFARSGTKKQFAWSLKTDEWLVGENAPPGLKVTFDGIDIADPRLLTIQIKNGGKKGIRPADVIHPLRIVVPEARIASYEFERERMVSRSGPAFSQPQADTIQIDQLEMNPGESFTMRLVVDGGRQTRVHVTSALFEESAQPKRQDVNAPPSLVAVWAPVALMPIFPVVIMGGIIASIIDPPDVGSGVDRGDMVTFGILVFIFVFIPAGLFSLFMTRRELRRRREALASMKALEEQH